MQNQEADQTVSDRVKAKRDFYIHLSVYIAVNTLLIIINLTTASESLWFKWPLLGWGIGLVFHALGVFVIRGGSTNKEG